MSWPLARPLQWSYAALMIEELLQSSSDEHVIVQMHIVLPEQQRHVVPDGQPAHDPPPALPPLALPAEPELPPDAPPLPALPPVMPVPPVIPPPPDPPVMLPPDDVIDYIAQETHVSPAGLTLLVAPTASQTGSIQIVARSVETALHKLHELGFDLARVESACNVIRLMFSLTNFTLPSQNAMLQPPLCSLPYAWMRFTTLELVAG